jgi:hypothetical protein
VVSTAEEERKSQVSPLLGSVRSEKQLARVIAGNLRRCYRYDGVYANVTPGASKYRDYYFEWFSQEPPLAQPDVDILVVHMGDLVGIELKYFKLQTGQFKRSYYEGIGQALALLRYGFDYVQLWHCFDQEVEPTQVTRFVENTGDLINKLKLPVGHASLRLLKQEHDVSANEMHVVAGQIYDSDKPPDIRRFQTETRNPLREQVEAKRMREFIQHVLRIPQT